jgi:hypothetical protein
MVLQTSGVISMKDITTEFDAPQETPIDKLYRGGTYVPDSGANAKIPLSGTISLADFYGASKVIPWIMIFPLSSKVFTLPGQTPEDPDYVFSRYEGDGTIVPSGSKDTVRLQVIGPGTNDDVDYNINFGQVAFFEKQFNPKKDISSVSIPPLSNFSYFGTRDGNSIGGGFWRELNKDGTYTNDGNFNVNAACEYIRLRLSYVFQENKKTDVMSWYIRRVKLGPYSRLSTKIGGSQYRILLDNNTAEEKVFEDTETGVYTLHELFFTPNRTDLKLEISK